MFECFEDSSVPLLHISWAINQTDSITHFIRDFMAIIYHRAQ